MAYEQRSGDISIFAETEKKNEKGPDWRGSMIVPEGVQPGDKLDVALWAKGGRGTMLAGSVKPPFKKADDGGGFRGAGSGGMAGSEPDLRGSDPFADDEVPFVTQDSIR